MAPVNVLNVLSPVSKYWKISQKAVTDNVVFRLHYKFTSSVLLACAILVTTNTLVGEPITCLFNAKAVHKNFINYFCWVHTTFTLPPLDKSAAALLTEAHPGVRPGPSENGTYHAFYQWVPFVLLLQSGLFYLPHYLWKVLEGSLVDKLTTNLRGKNMSAAERSERRGHQERVANYLVETLGGKSSYVWKFFLCEALNLANVVFNGWLVDQLLGGVFVDYGLKVLEFTNLDQSKRIDPMIAIFPRVTKCTFNKYGPSGRIELHDSMCILAINNFNEKIYIFFWFWLIILGVMSVLMVLRAVVVVLMSKTCVLKRMVRHGNIDGAQLTQLVRKASLGDVWLWQQVARNVPDFVFSEIFQEMCEKFDKKEADIALPPPPHMEGKAVMNELNGHPKITPTAYIEMEGTVNGYLTPLLLTEMEL